MNVDDFNSELDGIRDELAVLPALMEMGTGEAERHAGRRKEELKRQLQDLDIILQLHMGEEQGQSMLAEIGRLRRQLNDSMTNPLLGFARMPVIVQRH